MDLRKFKENLETVCDRVYHFANAGKQEYPMIIFAETGRNYIQGSNKIEARSWNTDVHVYTKTEYDNITENLEKLFNENRIPFDMEKIDYGRSSENPTDVIYYKYVCEV